MQNSKGLIEFALIVIISSLILGGTDELSCHRDWFYLYFPYVQLIWLSYFRVCVYIQSWHFYFSRTDSFKYWMKYRICSFDCDHFVIQYIQSIFILGDRNEMKQMPCMSRTKKPSEMIKKSITHLGTIPRAFIELLWPIRENDFHTHDQCNFHIKYTILT